MSMECSICERGARGPHDPSCPRAMTDTSEVDRIERQGKVRMKSDAAMTDTSQPTTAAGRALAEKWERYELWHPVDGRRERMVAAILAIEAEARAGHEQCERNMDAEIERQAATIVALHDAAQAVIDDMGRDGALLDDLREALDDHRAAARSAKAEIEQAAVERWRALVDDIERKLTTPFLEPVKPGPILGMIVARRALLNTPAVRSAKEVTHD